MRFIKHRHKNNELPANNDDVEIDVNHCKERTGLWIGHDKDKSPLWVPLVSFSVNANAKKTWYHAKDATAYKLLLQYDLRCFMHDKDPIAPVNGGFFWTTIPENIGKDTVFMDVAGTAYTPQQINLIIGAYGICSDDLDSWRAIYGNR